MATPSAAGQIERQRPLRVLRDALAAAPLVWMVGLPGAGKTSLAAQWIAQAQRDAEHALWYRLDEDDADIAGLFDALRRTAPPGLRDGLPAWSPDNQPELRAFSRRFFAQLCSGTPLTIVFDDCHRVVDGSAFVEMLDAARDVAGERLRLLLISRRPPPPVLARGLLAGWLRLVDDLGLELDEAAAIAQRVTQREWSAQEIERLREARGWMAHVLALAQSASGRSSSLSGDAAGRVADFLGHELLLMLPSAHRRAFRLLAELPEVPQALDASWLPSPCLHLLHDLASRRYFVETTANGSWRLHDLLRDGLRTLNAQHESPETFARARRELAAAVQARLPDAAMGLLVAAGDARAVLALLRSHGRSWLAAGRHRQLLTWIDALPPMPHEPGDADAAELLLWRAEALLPLEPERARPLLALSRRELSEGRRVGDTYRAWCGEVASYVVQWGAVQGLAELVDELERLQALLGPAPGEWAFRCAADALTALMYGRAEDPRVPLYAQATAHAVEHAPDAGSRITAAAQLLIYRMWWAGDFPGGRALYNAFDLEVERDDALAPLPRLIWWSNAAIVDWQCGDPARCYDKVDRGLALAEASGVHVRDFFLLTQGIFCSLSQEDWPRAEAYLQRLAQTDRSHRRLDTMVHHFFRSWYCLSRGDARTALAHAETALPMAEAMGSLFHKVIVLSALAPARLHTGDIAGAQAAYREQLALAKGSHNPTFSYIAFCSGAEIALVCGDEETLAKQVQRLLTVKMIGGYHSDCGWRTPLRARWLAFALERGILPEVARQWIREKRVPPPQDYRGEWPKPVAIRALHGLEVEVEGGAASSSAKPAARLRELLAVLVARRAGATHSELSDWLWPHTDGDKAAASLKVAVHRLRSWLGSETVVVRDGRVSLNSKLVDCDLWRGPADAALPVGDARQVLAGFDAAPVVALREQLASR